MYVLAGSFFQLMITIKRWHEVTLLEYKMPISTVDDSNVNMVDFVTNNKLGDLGVLKIGDVN